MRGKQCICYDGVDYTRITPADAGKTTHTPPLKAPQWDHPRGCGENQTQNPFAFPPQGSPPRMRGKLPGLGSTARRIRITPADAGKTLAFGFYQTRRWDHPRRCGENNPANYELSSGEGSPPQVRGKQFLALLHAAFKQDPPRRCGENTIGHEGDQGIKGSPPQVRGKPARIEAAEPLSRITPAGAGKTLKID